jgi:alkylation response protein AidB-like acyl-CoA dehydrogenase
MDFSWSEQQRELFNAVQRFAAAELNQNLIENDRAGVFNRDDWKKCGGMGIPGLAVPAEYGGLGQDPLTTVGALERRSYACCDNGLVLSLSAHIWPIRMVLVAPGAENQELRFLHDLSRDNFN